MSLASRCWSTWLWSASFSLWLAALPGASQQVPEILQPDPEPLPSPMRCPVEGDPVYGREFGCKWQGRRYYFDNAGCLRGFMENPEPYARELEPRAALFAPANPAEPAMGTRFLGFGIWIVTALFSGALSSYVAMQKGHPASPWFLTGFFLNLPGVVLAASRPSRETLFGSKGLSKIPQTHTPLHCPACSAANHPSAPKCSACGAALSPRVQSEVHRLGR